MFEYSSIEIRARVGDDGVISFLAEGAWRDFLEEIAALWFLSKGSHLEDIFLNERTTAWRKRLFHVRDNCLQESGADSEVLELKDKMEDFVPKKDRVVSWRIERTIGTHVIGQMGVETDHTLLIPSERTIHVTCWSEQENKRTGSSQPTLSRLSPGFIGIKMRSRGKAIMIIVSHDLILYL